MSRAGKRPKKKKRQKPHPKKAVSKPSLKKRNRPLELLAPAGSASTFFAAIDAGADALYLGATEFNARMRADNFSLEDLETVIPYAHSKNVKIYITLNTLVKQDELEQATRTILRLKELRPDAIIVQDLGLALIAMRLAPEIPLHGSTQMTIHNSAGAMLLKDLGFERVILARECTLDEIIQIGAGTGIELEVFAHGALCYSYSGQCYFSSYLGGASANRGRCTQPCRRSYDSGKSTGAFFSPKDLCLIDRLPELNEAGVVGIKIEGRLRSVSYISNVVSAFRKAIDSLPGKAARSVLEMAGKDFGRTKTHGRFDKDGAKDIINPQQTGTGQFLGKVAGKGEGGIGFSSRVALKEGDRLRVVSRFEGEKDSFLLKRFTVEKASDDMNNYSVPFAGHAKKGDLVFLVGHKTSSGSKKTIKSLTGKYRVKIKKSKNIPELASRALSGIQKELHQEASRIRKFQHQFIRVALPPGARDIIRLLDRRADEYIVPIKHREIFSLPRNLRNRVILRLPVFIRERELKSIKGRIREAVSKGFTRFLVGNPAHFSLLAGFEQARAQADYTFGALNSATFLALVRLGAEMVTVSLESDQGNLESIIKASRGFPLELVAYGRPPLFTSAIDPPLPKSRGPKEVKGRDVDLYLERMDKLTIVMPKVPFALMGHLKGHQARKMAFLRLELSPNELAKREYDKLRESVEKWAPLKGTKPFNYHSKSELR